MQEIDLRYALFLLPLFYVVLPFFLSGTFLILGGVTLIALITGMLIFIVVTNLNIGGSATAATVGSSANISLSSEGGYSLFVIFFGGLFYLGATLATFITPILNMFVSILNAILGFVSFVSGISTTAIQTTVVSGLGSSSAINLNQVYPLSITIFGISLFGALDVIFASMFILSLYFMVASRGK